MYRRPKLCFCKTGQEGHLSRDCPQKVQDAVAPPARLCYTCNQPGHQSRNCPQAQTNEQPEKRRRENKVSRPHVQDQEERKPEKANPISRTTSTTRSQITKFRFADLPISSQAKKALGTVLRYEFMTRVQAETIRTSLTGGDVLVKAKTGTGKTLAFLIPTLDQAISFSPEQRQDNVSVLIISPTRELAQQIADEAAQLMTHMRLSILCLFGGISIKRDHAALKRGVPDVIVATPGRLNDHLENYGLAAKMSNLRCLVFDEADQLLEMGFRPDITRMLNMLPAKETRQTLLFSATMPKDVMGIAQFALRSDFQHIDCVGAEQSTHQHVPQFYTVHPLETQFAELAQVLREGIFLAKDHRHP